MSDARLSYKLSAESLAAAKRILEATEDTRATINNMRASFTEKHNEIISIYNKVMRAEWEELSRTTGVPMEDLETGLWLLDMRYLEAHGDAFIMQRDSSELESIDASVINLIPSTKDTMH